MTIGIREAIHLPIVARNSAEQLGSVIGFVANPERNRLEAIHIGGPKRHPRLIDWTSIVSFGDDAVMIGDDDAAREPQSEAEQRTAKGSTTILDQRVLTVVGDELGTVTDLQFDPASGTIESVEIGDLRLDGERLRGIGTYAIVVAEPDDPGTAPRA